MEGLVLSRIDDIVPEFVNAETALQKVLSDKKSNSYEIRKAEQDFDKAVLKMKNEFDKAVFEITAKCGNYSIIIPHHSRRGAVHAR